MRKEFRSLLPLQEAQSVVLAHAPRAEVVRLPLDCGAGRVLAEKIVSPLDVPGFARASMDGYAVFAEDTLAAREDRPVSLRLAGSVPMGQRSHLRVSRGEAAEVSTGSMMPEGADGVVMVEYALVEGDRVLVRRPIYSGENLQGAGSDIALGESVLFPGVRLSAREVGVLAALGLENITVRSLRVGVVSTGNELVPAGSPLEPGRIFDINTYSIAAAVQECGAEPVRYGILADSKREMAETLLHMAEACGLILVSGSTSAGAGDMVYQVLDEIGETLFHGVNLKPGKPTLFGLIDGKPCLGLPGYPTSALTVFSLLAAPAIRKALGLRIEAHIARGRLAEPIRAEGRQQMLAVGLAGDLVYAVDKGSGSITTLAGADGVIEIPADVEYLQRGQEVEVRLFADLEAPELVVAGENSPLLEMLADKLSRNIRLLNTGSARGLVYLQDGVADVACVSGSQAVPSGTAVMASLPRELGLIFRDQGALQGPERVRIVGWHGSSQMRPAQEKALESLGIANARYARLSRTHSGVAAAVATGLADLGFGERKAAERAGLGFRALAKDEVRFLARPERLDDPALRSFISALAELEEARTLKISIAARSS